VSCPAVRACVAVGFEAHTVTTNDNPLVVTETSRGWSPLAAPQPARLMNSRQPARSAPCDAQLGCFSATGLPDGVELLQVLASDRRIVEARDAFGAIGPQPVDDGANFPVAYRTLKMTARDTDGWARIFLAKLRPRASYKETARAVTDTIVHVA